MLHESLALDEASEAEVRALVERCEASDGAPSCVQMDHSLNFRKDIKSWFLLHDADRLIGLASIFAPMEREGEISICVAPELRRRGCGGALLAAARRELERIGIARQLLVCDNRSSSGRAFVSRLGAAADHEEHRLELVRQVAWQNPRRLVLKEGFSADISAMTELFAAAFGDSPEETEAFVRASFVSGSERVASGRRAYIGLSGGNLVAACFVADEEGSLSINTLAVSPKEQGAGYGMEFLCALLDLVGRERHIVIDVDSENPRAIRLYEKAGFEKTHTTGYYLL